MSLQLLAGTIQWRDKPALTLTLSPEERERRSPVTDESLAGGFAPAREKLLPLPGGEGRGEGGRFSQLNNSGLVTSIRRCSARWLALTLAASGLTAAPDKSINMVVSNYAVPENFGPPHETQVKSLLEGDEAELQTSSHQVLIRGLKLQTFNETGTTQMVVRAPHCFYDYVQKSVASDGHLEVRSGDGRFFFEGDGFLLQQTNSTLTISNRVHTLISNSRPAAPKP